MSAVIPVSVVGAGCGRVRFLGPGGVCTFGQRGRVSGSVTVSGNRKTVQAPASGIIKNIVVKDGDKVKAGEV